MDSSTGRVCEDEKRLSEMERSGDARKAVGAYAMGQRTTWVMETLARYKVLCDNAGDNVHLPAGFDRGTWEDILSSLVMKRLGNLRCLTCHGYWLDTTYRCFITDEGKTIRAPNCPYCGGTLAEDVACTVGTVG